MAHKAKGNRRNLKHDLVVDRQKAKEFLRKREELKQRRRDGNVQV